MVKQSVQWRSGMAGAFTTLGALLAAPQPAISATLPITCASGVCNGGPSTFVTSGQASAASSGNTLTITQSSDKAILNWSSFNVSADGKVIFNQPTSSSVALNRIFQASPSQIFGLVQANGQIYLINQNGFIFGKTAQVNAGGLIASSLNINDSAFDTGITSTALLAHATAALDGTGQAAQGPIVIDQGAQISTNHASGRLLFAAPSISNSGTLSAPDGQVVLAAGQKVYLQASTDPNLRGLLVEVDGGGNATNEIQGLLTADRGNVSMIGLAVNQLGRISATTSVAANGSVRLLARDTTKVERGPADGTYVMTSNNGGTLTVGSQGVISAQPDATDTAMAVDGSQQLLSTIDLEARHVVLAGGSQILAHGGNLNVTARSDFSRQFNSFSPDDASIRVDNGALVDLSGSDATVSVTRNLVSVQLNANEMANSPDQRNGVLRGQTVVVDARVGTSVADVSGALDLIKRNVYERTSLGGAAKFDSSGDLAIGSSATLNVSGGAINYTPGTIATTLLVSASGAIVDIGAAKESTPYASVINPLVKTVTDKWGVVTLTPTPGMGHLDPGYVEGKAAGSIQFASPAMVLNGKFLGNTVHGQYQRSSSTYVPGGLFIIGVNDGSGDFRAPAVDFVKLALPDNFTDSAALSPGQALALPTEFLAGGGFTRVQINANGAITVPADVPLKLPAYGSINLVAPRVEVDSGITIPGGTVSLKSQLSNAYDANEVTGLGLFIGDGVAFDLRGNWTNDFYPASTDPAFSVIAQNGGVISMQQSILNADLSLGNRVALEVSGGAWQPATGGKVSPGKGGRIMLDPGQGGTLLLGEGISLDAFGVQGAAGGSLTLSAPRIDISSGGSAWAHAQQVGADPLAGGILHLDTDLFSDFGFSAYTLNATAQALTADASQTTLTVEPGSLLSLQTRSLVLASAASAIANTADVTGFAHSEILPEYFRPASSLTLRTSPLVAPDGIQAVGGLKVGSGALISADPKSTITLQSVGTTQFDGAILAHSGAVTIQTLSTPSLYDVGYQPALRIDLGSHSSIDVSGTVLYKPNAIGALQGDVLGGGSIALAASRGSIAAEAGSRLDFSGASAPIDIQGPHSTEAPARLVVASSAGSLSLSAPENISLLGELSGHAGVGATGTAAGGSLAVTLSRFPILSGFSTSGVATGTYPTDARIIKLVAESPTAFPDVDGLAVLGANAISAAGIDALQLSADDAVEFSGTVNLDLARSFTAQSPAIRLDPGAKVSLSAAYTALGTGVINPVSGEIYTMASPTAGNGTISVSAQGIDLIGHLAVQGTKATSLSSSGIIQLRGDQAAAGSTGSFAVTGPLGLSSAAVAPGTGVAFTLSSTGATDSTITFTQAGKPGALPLSAGGSITVAAQSIVQDGTLLAPFGRISLEAGNQLTLGAGSVTSVSGNGTTIPYGRVDNGKTWVYGVDPSQPNTVSGIPARKVQLQGATVDFSSGATVDVSGGGDLYAYEWTPGSGGSADALGPAATNGGLYAVVPSLQGQLGPFDPMLYSGTHIGANRSVYLSGGSGLAAGNYTLLPARYALLPGAYLVSAVAGYTDLQPGTVLASADGAPIVSGRFSYGTTGLGDTRTQGFVVRPGNYAGKLATYTDHLASDLLADSQAALRAGGLPRDGGTLLISVQNALNALGAVVTKAAKGGENASIELSAPQVDIVAALSSVPTSGTVELSTATVNNWAPGRLLVGGRSDSDGSVVVDAGTVNVAAGDALALDQIVLVANEAINIGAGAVIESTSGKNNQALPAARAPAQTPLNLAGTNAPGAAFVAVSDLAALSPQRASGSGTSAGRVTLGANATLASRGSLTVDVPGGADLSAGVLTGDGAYWLLGGAHVVVGPTPVADALNLNTPLIGALSAARNIRIASTGSIDLDQALNLASPSATKIAGLTLIANSINNLAPGSHSVLSATQITLGSDSASSPVVGAGTGTITFDAQHLDLAAGNMGLSGFDTVALNATGDVTGIGTGGLVSSGNVNVTTALVTAQGGAHTLLSAPTGTLTLLAPADAQSTATPALQTGGALTLSAQLLDDRTRIVLPSGDVRLEGTQGLLLGNGAAIDVAGILPAVAGIAHGSSGGRISLSSSAGDVSEVAGVTLDVSASKGAQAGLVQVSAYGEADLQGSFSGVAGAGRRSGSFALNSGSLTGFSSLNQRLEAGLFDEARSFHVASGNLDLAAGESITARHVALTADTGIVTIEGKIDASGSGERGTIDLAAGTDLSIGSTAIMLANAADNTTLGGHVTLSARTGNLAVAEGADLEAKGLNGSGRLVLRASALDTDTDLAKLVGLPAGQAGNVDQLVVEPLLSYTLSSGNPAAAEFSTDRGLVATFMGAAPTNLLNRLGLGTASNASVLPYVDMSYTGDLTLPALNLSTWRFNAAPVALAVRATGNIVVAGAITDGLVATPTVPGSKTTYLGPMAGQSASITLVAGADLSGAAMEGVVAGSTADLTLQPGVAVRTGTGDIALAAARDINFGAGATVFTAGKMGAANLSGKGQPVMTFPDAGGDVILGAGRDVIGSVSTQQVTDWMPVNVLTRTTAASWGINAQNFGWNLGALGGGAVSITSGRDVVDITAAVADSSKAGVDGVVQAFGGGDLSIDAGRNVDTAYLYVGKGTGRIRAWGEVGSSQTDTQGAPIGSLLMAGDASYAVQAQGNLLLQGETQATAVYRNNGRYFFRYGEGSTLALASNGGDVTLSESDAGFLHFLGGVATSQASTLLTMLAPSTDIAAYASDINLQNIFFSYASNAGAVNWYAGRDLNANGIIFRMLDTSAALLPTAATPTADAITLGADLSVSNNFNSAARHTGDLTSSLLAVGRDINALSLISPKAVRLTAGRDIYNLNFSGQNANPNDATIISAGRDLTYVTDAAAVNNSISVGGGGSLEILAGRNIDFGFAAGVTTTGRLVNANLSTPTGASISMFAGLGAPLGVDKFLSNIVAPSADYRAQLISYVEPLSGSTGLSYDAAAQRFSQMNEAQQSSFLVKEFFSELVKSGREANSNPALGFGRGYAAIDALFPGSRTTSSPYLGDLTMAFSRIYTLDGGSINLLVPGGRLDVGLANPPADLAARGLSRPPSQLGIVAEKSGDVNIYAKGDVLVNTSRVFTLGGGNIAIWSDLGSIDAGRGAKSAISAPPPTVIVDSIGNVTIDFSAAVAGSGIRTIQTNTSETPGNVDLIAPNGVVNAGEAGIGSAGNLNIAAVSVLGVGNIEVGGSATGVPPEVSGLGVSLAAASSAGASASASESDAANGSGNSKDQAPMAQAALSWLEVFILGLGEDNCRPDDMDCLRRQQRPN
jgi:filamentous hemagglutinin family protein